MAKKDFTKGLNTLLGDEAASPDEIKPTQEPVKKKEISEVRATFIIKEDKLELVKALAYWERRQLKDLIDEVFNNFLITKKPEYLEEVLTEFNKLKK